MAFVPYLTDDIAAISALPDQPNVTGGLSPAQLKAKFDYAGGVIKEFINSDIVPAINGDVTFEDLGEW